MEKLYPLIQSGELSEDAIEFIYKNSKILTEHRGRLADHLVAAGQPRGKNMIPHHLLPIIPKELEEAMELTFLKRGLDPNSAEFGMWLRKNIHDMIHRSSKEFGAGGVWNYHWKQFFAAPGKRTEADIRDFLAKMRKVLKDIEADPSKPIRDYSWPPIN